MGWNKVSEKEIPFGKEVIAFNKEWINSDFNILQMATYRMSDVSLYNDKNFKKEKWAEHVYVDIDCAAPDNFFIACPKSNLQERPVIMSKPIDPIIFQYCPFGVLIYTMWGDEAEDKVFEEYKKLNTIK